VAVVESTATVLYAPAFWSKLGEGRKLMDGVRMGGRFRSQLAICWPRGSATAGTDGPRHAVPDAAIKAQR